MNHSGDSHDAYSVIIDSALGLLGAAPKDNDEFLGQIKWLQDYLANLPPPKYPFPVDAARAAAGKAVFDQHCASCHASDKTGTPHAARRRRHRQGTHRHLEQEQRDRGQQGRDQDGDHPQGPGRGRARGLQPAVPRRHLGARAVSAQRFGAHAARPARASRRVVPGTSGAATTCTTRKMSASFRRAQRPSESARGTTPRSVRTATAGTFSAPRCRPRTRRACSSI